MDHAATLVRALGIERLVLEIHDASFPGDPDEDVGRGSPYSAAGRRFLEWIRGLGFDGVQLGPQGQTSLGNKSPYDGRVFGRDFLSLPLSALRARGLIDAAGVARLVRPPGDRVRHREAWAAMSGALAGTDQATIQRILDEEHRSLRAGSGLRFYGDQQIGMAPEDAEAYRHLFLPGFCMGAPPSRTNPEGQPWGYPVFDPRRRALVVDFLRARARWMAAGYDGVRLDHPHGLVCPWVYPEGAPVADGARLHESPDVADLAPYAIARAEQIDRSLPRHADGWVRDLDPAQVDRYDELAGAVLEEMRGEVVCEVLSTLPYPLARVLSRHGLGRFRVAQKLSLDDPEDVYRIERAGPADWIMAGNHDTPPVWRLVDGWPRDRWAAYLGGLLGFEVSAEPRELVHALFAAIFASRARRVLIFFPDLLGMTETYNVPGTVNEENWTLRVPPDYEARQREAGLDLVHALRMALRARGSTDR